MTVPFSHKVKHPDARRMSFYYGDEKIIFERLPRKENINRVSIKVYPDCRIIVTAPEQAGDAIVLAAVKKRSRWLYKQLRNFQQQNKYLTPRKYISGESHYYLGKQYMLKVIEASKEEQGVKLFRGKLEIHIYKKNAEKIQQMLADWYKDRAKEVFAKRLDAMLEQTLWVKQRPQVRTHNMKTQWGSCSPNGRITLNPHLVKAPRECIDYVILHELCHIAEHNHSKKFYRLVKSILPEWEKYKIKLDEMANKIIPI